MTDLRGARIDVSLQTPDGKLQNCDTTFTVDNLQKDLDYNDLTDGQQIGTMTCEGDSTSYNLVRLNNETIGVAGTTYEITLPDDAAHLILTPPKTATSIVPFNPNDEAVAKEYETSPILVRIEFDTPQDIGEKKGITSHYKRFENLAAFKAWLPEGAAGTVKGVWALKSGGSTEKPVWVSFDNKEERDGFLSGGEGFILITRKDGNDSEPKTIFSAEDLKTELARINGLADAERPDRVILIHLQNTNDTNKLNATTFIDTPDRIAAYAEYINEQESEGAFSLGAFDVHRRTWFQRNGVDLRARFGWSSLLQQRASYTDRNPNVTTGGIDQEYGQDYAAAQAAQEDKKFFEGLGIGFGATLYLGAGIGVGLDFDWSRMKADWAGIDPTHGSEFDRIMLDLELRWSLARTFDSKWSGFKYFDPQIYGNLGYGYIHGNTTLQESFNPISTDLDFGFGTIGLDVPVRVCKLSDNWIFNLGPYIKGVFPFAEQFRDPRYGSTDADLSPYFETGVLATFAYRNTSPDTVTPTVDGPEYVKPAEKPVDLASDKTVPEPKGPTIPGVIELPPPQTEKITIQANFKTGLLDLNPSDAAQVTAQLAKIKAIVRPGMRYVIRVDGHADSRGTWTDNERLSMGRANEYKNLLLEAAIKQGDADLIAALQNAIIFVKGYGESKPLTQDGSVIDTTGLGDGKPVVRGNLGTLSNGAVEDLDKSRRIELSFEALEPGAPVPLPPEISTTQKAADKKVADAIAARLTGGAIEGAYYEESDNSLNIIINDFSPKKLAAARTLFLKQIRAIQKAQKASLSSQCTVRFVMHGNPTQAEQDIVKGFYKFGEWPTAAGFEYVLESSTAKKRAFIEELRGKTRQRTEQARARKQEIEAGVITVTIPAADGGTAKTFNVYPIKVTNPSTGLPAADKLIVSRLIASGSLQPTFYYNFNATGSDRLNYMKEIAGLAGDKRADVSRVYTSENPGARLDGEYLFLIVGETQVDLSNAEDATARAVREAIFKKCGPQRQ